MIHNQQARAVTIEELPPPVIDDERFEIAATYFTPQGTVVVVREWPSIQLDK